MVVRESVDHQPDQGEATGSGRRWRAGELENHHRLLARCGDPKIAPGLHHTAAAASAGRVRAENQPREKIPMSAAAARTMLCEGRHGIRRGAGSCRRARDLTDPLDPCRSAGTEMMDVPSGASGSFPREGVGCLCGVTPAPSRYPSRVWWCQSSVSFRRCAACRVGTVGRRPYVAILTRPSRASGRGAGGEISLLRASSRRSPCRP